MSVEWNKEKFCACEFPSERWGDAGSGTRGYCQQCAKQIYQGHRPGIDKPVVPVTEQKEKKSDKPDWEKRCDELAFGYASLDYDYKSQELNHKNVQDYYKAGYQAARADMQKTHIEKEWVRNNTIHLANHNSTLAAKDAEIAELKGVLDFKNDEYVRQVGTWKIINRLEESEKRLEDQLAKRDLAIAKMREGLEKYSDEANWFFGRLTNLGKFVASSSLGRNAGFEVAREALEATDKILAEG